MSGHLETVDGGLYVAVGNGSYKLMTFTEGEIYKHKSEMLELTSQNGPDKQNELKHDFSEQPPTGPQRPVAFSRRPSMTPVRDQGSRGTCTVFGALAQHEFNWQRSRDFSEQYLYWAAKTIDNSSEGTWIKDAWASLFDRGVCNEATGPYTSTQPVPKWGGPDPGVAAHQQAASQKGKQAWWRKPQDTDDLEKCIYELGYVITLQVTVWWSSWPSSGDITMPTAVDIERTREMLRSIGKSDGEHVICLCGYNQTTRRFEFKNSWNSTWGAGGFGTIPYEYVHKYGRDPIVFQSA